MYPRMLLVSMVLVCVRVCVCVCVCVRARARACVYACVCTRRCVCACVCFVGADGCIPLSMLIDVCQCCCLLLFICLPPFDTLSLLQNLVTKDSESEL